MEPRKTYQNVRENNAATERDNMFYNILKSSPHAKTSSNRCGTKTKTAKECFTHRLPQHRITRF